MVTECVSTLDRPYQLLITDDNQSFRQVLREVLEQRPELHLFEAECGEEAVEIVRCRRIDIVLLDMHMKVMTGLETLRELKRLDVVRPCILITSDATEDLCRDAREANAWSVLKKPVPRRELLQNVSAALSSAYRIAFDD
jgi:two-component system, response regulator PdtaR